MTAYAFDDPSAHRIVRMVRAVEAASGSGQSLGPNRGPRSPRVDPLFVSGAQSGIYWPAKLGVYDDAAATWSFPDDCYLIDPSAFAPAPGAYHVARLVGGSYADRPVYAIAPGGLTVNNIRNVRTIQFSAGRFTVTEDPAGTAAVDLVSEYEVPVVVKACPSYQTVSGARLMTGFTVERKLLRLPPAAVGMISAFCVTNPDDCCAVQAVCTCPWVAKTLYAGFEGPGVPGLDGAIVTLTYQDATADWRGNFTGAGATITFRLFCTPPQPTSNIWRLEGTITCTGGSGTGTTSPGDLIPTNQLCHPLEMAQNFATSGSGTICLGGTWGGSTWVTVTE
jgi:hypothetical protein